MKNIILICVLFLLLVSQSNAQTGTIIINKVTNPPTAGIDFVYRSSPTLTVISPFPSVYSGGYATFGPELDQTGVTAALQLVPNEGCNASDFAGFIPGTIALIDRGVCQFTLKVSNAQAAGAIGVIIVNNAPGGGAINMGGTDPSIIIPSIFISYEDGLILKSLSSPTVMINKTLEDFTLQHNESKVFNNVPAGTYTITEELALVDSAELIEILLNDPGGESTADVNLRRVVINLNPGETVECTFVSEIRLIEDLSAKVDDLLNTGVINSGQANALTSKLSAAKNKIDQGKLVPAINLLNAFINQVMNFMNNGILTTEQGQPLIDEANTYVSIIQSVLPKSLGLTDDSGLEKIPETFSLLQNFPNPFNPVTRINYSVPADAHVKITVHNTLGQKVAELVNQKVSAGNHEVTFNAATLSSGVYYYRIEAGDFVSVKKMILMK